MKTIHWQTTFGLEGANYASRLILSERQAYSVPYGSAMAQGLSEDVSGYLTYQGKPVAVFMDADNPEAMLDKEIWDRLWNQGLASVLIFHCPDKVKVYSLVGLTDEDHQDTLKPIEVLNKIELGIDAYRAKCVELIRRLEDGSYYSDYWNYFKAEHRVDKHLLSNLVSSCDRLTCFGLQRTEAQALLLQTIFIAYLEDRGILNPSDFFNVTEGRYGTLAELLQAQDVQSVFCLFEDLSEKFNSDVFSSPCSFDKKENSPLAPQHLTVLWEFRSGKIDCSTRQCSLLPLYDFKFIPVELLSAIYDHFQGPGADGTARRDTGSYFTPAFVAQTCLDLAWRYVPAESVTNPSFSVLDPSCGSAVFLVCAFQRLAGLARAHGQALTWDGLGQILMRVHGIDISENALRVGIVSLYIALLEHIDPPALTPLFKQGKILPPLLNVSMRASDFFSSNIDTTVESYDLIIGNPPWVSRRKKMAQSMLKWCADNGYQDDVPGYGLIWGFIWKAALMIKDHGVVALLVEAKQLLFNVQAENSRQRLFREYRIPLIVNGSDARHQWFDGADAPGALCVIQRRDSDCFTTEETDYWSIKANPEYSIAQRVVLAPEDHIQLKQWRLAKDSSPLSLWQWGRSRDAALLNNLQRFNSLGTRLIPFKEWRQSAPQNMWCIGQGLTPSSSERTPITTTIEGLSEQPFVSARMENFRWQLPTITDVWHRGDDLHFARIIEPLLGTRTLHPPIILIKQGVSKLTGLMKATYTDQRVCFQHSLQAIISPQGQDDSATFKVLTAVLNSQLAAWFYLHASAARGVERDKVHQGEITLLPFPMPDESDDPRAAEEIVELMDWYARARRNERSRREELLYNEAQEPVSLETRFNELVYRYYGINEHERCVIEDAVKYIIPSMQPGKTSLPILWTPPWGSLLEQYARFIRDGLAANYLSEVNIGVTIYSGRHPLLLAEITRDEESGVQVRRSDKDLAACLNQLNENWPDEFAMGVHHLADLTFALKNKIYLIKPNRVRHWMPSSALCDVDRIVSDLYAAKTRLS